MKPTRNIALFIILVARALVVSANAFGLGIFFVFLFLVIEWGTLLFNLIHYCSWSRWLSVYGSLSIFWSFTLLAIMCTNSFRFLPSVKKLGVSMFMSCPFFTWMIKEKENHILCIFGWKTRRICHFQKRKAKGKFRLHMVLDHNLFLYTNVPYNMTNIFHFRQSLCYILIWN